MVISIKELGKKKSFNSKVLRKFKLLNTGTKFSYSLVSLTLMDLYLPAN